MAGELEDQFHAGMEALYLKAAEIGYRPTDFRKMVHQHGGLIAAQMLLATKGTPAGFTELYLRGRLDLSMEALVIQPAFWPLFSQPELDVAWKRLFDVGYFENHPMSRPVKSDEPHVQTPANPLSLIQRENILAAIAELDAGLAAHPYKTPTKYLMKHEGRTYAPKAVVGIALRIATGQYPSVLYGGEAHTNQILRRLGFQIEPIQTIPANADPDPNSDWTEDEVSLLVADYFTMLGRELAGADYNKTKHRRGLQAAGINRSNGSIEFKHQNLSAVLIKMGLPYIGGYKPRGNYQRLLAESVEAYLAAHPSALDEMQDSRRLDPLQAPAIRAFAELLDDAPEQIIVPEPGVFDWRTRKAKRIDFARRDAENRNLGALGEQFVVELERQRLAHARRSDLSQKVRWVARDFGDGTGFDVLSFDEQDDKEKLIEVKTTGLPKEFPFYVSSTEVRCSEAHPDAYHLYRLFNFSSETGLYILCGALPVCCELEPIAYRAGLKSPR